MLSSRTCSNPSHPLILFLCRLMQQSVESVWSMAFDFILDNVQVVLQQTYGSTLKIAWKRRRSVFTVLKRDFCSSFRQNGHLNSFYLFSVVTKLQCLPEYSQWLRQKSGLYTHFALFSVFERQVILTSTQNSLTNTQNYDNCSIFFLLQIPIFFIWKSFLKTFFKCMWNFVRWFL